MNPLRAAGPINLGDSLTLGISGGKVSDVYKTPADFVNLLVPTVFAISGVVIFILIVYSGFLSIQDTSKGKDEARRIWTSALIGLIVMFSAYWIIQIVEIIIGQDILI